MNKDRSSCSLPAPCIIDTGIILNKQDMRRLLVDLGKVHYIHTLDGKVQNQGEGCILEVFAEAKRSTMIVNKGIYLNLESFDYLELQQSANREAYFDLIQDNRQLRLIPLSNPLKEDSPQTLDDATLEAMVTQVLSARWDVHFDDEESF